MLRKQRCPQCQGRGLLLVDRTWWTPDLIPVNAGALVDCPCCEGGKFCFVDDEGKIQIQVLRSFEL